MKLVGQTYHGHPGKEALEIVGRANVIIRRCTFTGGSTCLRLIDCPGAVIEDCTFADMTGPPDPDGNGIQLIRSTASIRRCAFTASPDTEDLLSIYADVPTAGTVLVDGCWFGGKGKSGSGTSLCLDGPYCPQTTVIGCTFTGARCAITIAGGVGHTIKGCGFRACGVEVYQHPFYLPAPFGPFTITGAAILT